MSSLHNFEPTIIWTGNRGDGTKSYTSFDRTWDIASRGISPVHCSNDPRLGGDPSKLNPEDLLISALASCHMLWFLHLASEAQIIVHAYQDTPQGRGQSERDGSGNFVAAVLRPKIVVAQGADLAQAEAIHHRIHEVCFIARSISFPVEIRPLFSFENERPSA